MDLTGAVWRRSRLAERDGAEPQVELAMLDDGHVAVRTSGASDDAAFVFTPAEWQAFLLGAKDGEFDLPDDVDTDSDG